MSLTLAAQDLTRLQDFCKRDPAAYRQEFMVQLRRFASELQLFTMQPDQRAPSFGKLVNFLSQVMVCYPRELAHFPVQIKAVLAEHRDTIHRDARFTLLRALVLHVHRGQMRPAELLAAMLPLFGCDDKKLRKFVSRTAVAVVRDVNRKTKAVRFNREAQTLVQEIVTDGVDRASSRSLQVMLELYRRRVWDGARAVNIIAQAVFSAKAKVSLAAVHFFLGIEEAMADVVDSDDDDEDDGKAAAMLQRKTQMDLRSINYHQHAKKTRANMRKTRKALKKRKKLIHQKVIRDGGIAAAELEAAREKKLERAHADMVNHARFPALELIHDPQAFVEKLFARLKKGGQPFEVRLQYMDLISRAIGFHKLLLLGFYSWLQRYVTAHQSNVTRILAYLATACHDLVPPATLVPVVRAIVDNFVTDRRSNEFIAVGLNATRLVVGRIPLILEEEGMKTLVSDLIQFRKSKSKSVVVAARSFINELRMTYPEILPKAQRGRENVKGETRPMGYGGSEVTHVIEGTELLGDGGGEGGESDGWTEDSDDEGAMAFDDFDGSGEEEDPDAFVATSKDSRAPRRGSAAGSAGEDGAELVEESESEGDGEDLSGLIGSDGEGSTVTAASSVAVGERLEGQRMLTDRELQKLQRIREKRAAARATGSKAQAQQSSVPSAADGRIDFTDLAGFEKKRRAAINDRLSSVMAGRSSHARQAIGGGSTNAEKKRKKNFTMVQHSRSVRAKFTMSLKQKDRALGKQIKKLERAKKKTRSGRR